MDAPQTTPLEHHRDLGEAMGLSDLYLKREDLHPYGSHKGRSIPPMIDAYHAAGDRRFAISSSGNAALAAALYIKEKGDAELDVFVGQHAAAHKLDKLKKIVDAPETGGRIRVLIKERPLQALAQAMNDGARSLRQSTDDTALMGYASLAEELSGISAVFIGTSSGTTAQALAAFFIKNKIATQVHIVQTSSCHPLSDAFGVYEGPDERSDADAITDITGLRKPMLIPLIEQTGGRGWFATNENIGTAQELTKKHTGLDISPNSALSVAGAIQAAYAGHEIDGPVACIIAGD